MKGPIAKKFRNITRMERPTFSISFLVKQTNETSIRSKEVLNLCWKHFRKCILVVKFHLKAPRFIASTCESSLFVYKAAAHELQSHLYSYVQAQTNRSKSWGEQAHS